VVRPLAIAILLSLASCASTYRARVEARLVDMGLSRSKAQCIAERLVDKLSESQLRELGRLAGFRNHDIGKMTIAEFLHRVKALRDPEIVEVTTRAALGCAIRG
jgi:hypothetical protein